MKATIRLINHTKAHVTVPNPSALRRFCAIVLVTASLSTSVVLAQQQFEAIPKAKTSQYHFDFSKNYFPNPGAEKADRANLYATVKQRETLKGHVKDSAENLLRALQLLHRSLVALSRRS
jgi:hypothetical protein